eukprot:TRINITY_DN10268_c0_g1_i1.p1 TRINITY_DN10268_c0_g1~~TRINITY_DN10268_c0_g1_i1.p1  ORF type:complete len:297 (+),score=116.47 TRINITY_DN10268_c0_g1_i1:84-974(+)
MAHPIPVERMDRSMAPPPCKIEQQPEQMALQQADAKIREFYGMMDNPQTRAAAQGMLRGDTVGSFQKGPTDRFSGAALLQNLQRCHQGQQRDMSGLSVQIFGGTGMFCLLCGDMMTASSAATGVRARFADFFLMASDAQGPHFRNMVMREIDEDMGAPSAGAVQDQNLAQADQIAAQFIQSFYAMLDDPARRPELAALVKEQTALTVGKDLFKGTQHIAHKLHYMPVLNGPGCRKPEGLDVQLSPAGGLLIFSHGEMQLQGEVHSQRFIDAFHVVNEGGAWWITNMILKMHGGGSV